MAIWIHKHLGIGKLGAQPLLVEESDLTILHEAPRLIVAVATIGELKIGLVSGHCPHASRQVERDAFLKQLQPLLLKLKHTALTLGGIDLNGRVPTPFSGVAGNLEFGEPDEAGWRFAALLADNGMWIPSTFPSIHCGEVITYIHPSGQPHRIDYLFVGGKASITQARSEVDENFDTGSPQEDHKLLQLCIQGHMDPAKAPARLFRVQYDRDKLLTREGRECIAQALSSYVHPGWDVNPDQHCHALEQFLHKELTAHFAVPPKNRRATYIPDSVWQLREKKASFKRRVRHRASLWTALLCRAFHLWRTGQDYGVLALLGKQRFLYELSSAAIRFVTALIKRSIMAAKNTFLQGVAGEDHQGAAKILQRVKKAGMGGRSSRPISRPLPLLLHPEDGSVITTRVQRDDVWMLHFGKQEQGQALPIESFIRDAASSCLDDNVEWSIDMLPSYSDIEQVLRDIPRNKAAGLDNIPGEVLKAAPAAAAHFLFPLFIKSMLLQRQPLQWRGGILYEAFKRSGLQSSVENYRSLFVSSYVAKTYHRVVRNKTQSYCRDELHPMHLGSRRQAPVTFASLFVLSHMRWCHRTKTSAAVLFLDTSAAYYRLVRELAVGDIRSDDTVVNLFRTFGLGLDEDDLHELLHTVQEGGMLAQAGAPDALRQVVKDLHLHTWFVSRFSDGTRVCSSLAGSRPGESWADLIYAYIYGRVLHKVHEYAVAEQLTHSVPYDSTAGIFATDQCDEDLSATDTTWADDSAFPLADVDPEALERKTIRLCTLVISFCEGHGMAPNLKPGKTGVLLSLQGRGSKRARRRFFPEGTQRLHLPDLDVGVAVTEQYKHLGGYVDCKLTMRPEVRFRLAQATSSYEAAKSLLLNNPRLQLATRAALFASAVTPTFFNIGMWIPAGKSWDSLANGYSKLVRRLLVTDVGPHEVLHTPLPIAHWYTGCWRLELVARRARFSLLLSLVQAGPPLLWATLQNEKCWLQVIQEDLQWLVHTELQDWPGISLATWPEWHSLLRHQPQRLRRRLRQRLEQTHEEQCQRDIETLCLWHCCRTLLSAQAPTSRTFAWTCLLCNKSLRTKAALGAHFFKVHGRVATYRRVATGSKCHACCTEFWTEGRLAAHLRASHGCVAVLQGQGKSTDAVRPGFGSRLRRQTETAAFTLAVPLRQGQIPPAPATLDDSQESKQVFRDLCALLLSFGEGDLDGLEDGIVQVLRQSPLFPDEILSILNKTSAEISELHADGLQDPWSTATVDCVLQALESARSRLWASTVDPIPSRLYHSLSEFRSLLLDFDWTSRVQSLRQADGTPSVFCFHILPNWEAEWRQNCKKLEVSAVAKDVGLILPEALRRAWQCLLKGCTVQLYAPLSFWNLPLAAPFQGTRAANASTN